MCDCVGEQEEAKKRKEAQLEEQRRAKEAEEQRKREAEKKVCSTKKNLYI